MKNYRLKPKVFIFLFGFVFVLYSCQKEESNTTVKPEAVNSEILAKSNKSKIDICHKGKVLNVSLNAVSAHQGHGDAVDLDGDGFFDIANDCSEMDCDDNDPKVNSIGEEICDNGLDDDCDGDIDEDCMLLPAPLAFYPFNGNADDASGNGNDGQVNGAILTTDRFGTSNSAYKFDGIDDFIRIPSASENILDSGDFTVSVWFIGTSTDESVIWDKRNTSNCSQTSGPMTGMSQTNLFDGNVIRTFAGPSEPYNLYSKGAVNIGSWFNAVFVREGNIMTLYLNGRVEETVNITTGINFSTTLDLFIGGSLYCSGVYYEGKIDDFTIYGQALSGNQISYLYNLD